MIAVEDLLKKLEPQLGKRAEEMYRIYLLEDAKGRNEIHQYLSMLYDQTLTTPMQDKIVLVPPPGDLAQGDMPIAVIQYADKDLYTFCLRKEELPMHVLVVGDTGSGKTNALYTIISNFIFHKIPFLIFDWKREFRKILNAEISKDVLLFTVGSDVSPFYFNPLIAPRGVDPEIYLKKIVDNISYAYFLGEGVAELMREILHETNTERGVYSGDVKEHPNYFDALEKLEGMKPKGRELLWFQSTKRTLRALTFGKYGHAINVREDVEFEKLLEKNVIIELDALNKVDGKFLITSILSRIYFYRLAHTHEKKKLHAIIIDEAHHLFLKRPLSQEGEEYITDILLREARGLGECLVLSDQYPHMLTYTAFGVYTKIVMSLGNRSDINLAADILLLNKDEKEWLGKLPIGSAIVKLKARYPSPFLVHFPLIKLSNEPVTDDMVRERMKSYWQSVGGVVPVIPAHKEGYSPQIRPSDVIPKRDKSSAERVEKLLLMDILSYPLSSTVQRYDRLGLSKRMGNQAKELLEKENYIRIFEVPTKTARVKLLELTDKAKNALKSWGENADMSLRHGGVEHLFWVNMLAKKSKITNFCQKMKFKLQVEFPIGEGKTVDLVIENNNRKIAFEVETGSSDAIANIGKCLKAGFEKVYCIPTSYSALKGIADEIVKRNLRDKRIKVAFIKLFF